MGKSKNNQWKKKKIYDETLKGFPEDREAQLRRIMINQEESDYLHNLRRRLAGQEESPYAKKPPPRAMNHMGGANSNSGTDSDAGKDTVESELVGSLHDFQLEPQVSPKPADTAKQSAPVKPESTETIPSSPAPAAPPVEPAPTTSESAVQPGTIVRLEDGTVAIFEQDIPNKEYDIFLVVKPNGKLEPKGLSLYAYQWQQIGSVPGDLLAQMIKRKRWERDALIYYLDCYEYAKLIPNQKSSLQKIEQKPPESKPSRANSQPENAGESKLERGRVISIASGDKMWKGVYWGSNNMGAIIAHHTHKTWSLMHLDLKRFEDSLIYGDLLDAGTIRKIEQELTKNHSLE